MIDRSEWVGLVAGRRTSGNDRAATLDWVGEPAHYAGSGAFRAIDTNGVLWWVKSLGNLQGERVVVTEAIVGLVGKLIGAPVCDTTIIRIPDTLSGREITPGYKLEPGLAHGSRAVYGAFDEGQLEYRDKDDNSVHHAGVFALYDWCWGGDPQWLYLSAEEFRLYSHDHGWYLPGEDGTWNEKSLTGCVEHVHTITNEPELFDMNSCELDANECLRLAARLRHLSRDDLAGVLAAIPIEWPVSDSELECVGWFLERRANPVADRLENQLGRKQ